MTPLRPFALDANFVPQSYRGGGRSARFRGIEPEAAPSPEDWIASVTTRFGDAPSGLSRLPDGTLLRDAIAQSPEEFLGPAHCARFGSDPGLLVKLLDASERLVVHCHPDRTFAHHHLGCAHGKTEAWLVLEARPGAEVFVAFERDIERAQLDEWVADQAVEAMLGALHRLEVTAGSAVLVPAGLPHAIGDGVLVLELQEPTDFSVMLEQGEFANGDLGLGFDVALGCVDRTGWSPERVSSLRGPGLAAPGRVLPVAADPFFRATRLGSDVEIDQGFSLLVALAGEGALHGAFPGGPVPLSRGSTVLVPYSAGPVRAIGPGLELVRCQPPAPDAASPARPEL